jgi:predicted permease
VNSNLADPGIAVYRLLLRLLPKIRRQRFGEDMTLVFADERRAAYDAGGRRAVGLLWMKEAASLVRISVRDRVAALWTRLTRRRRPGRNRFRGELRDALRGLRARRWQSAFMVLLLGVAMAANVVVFSAADAFVFNRAPFRDADRLVVLQRGGNARDNGIADYMAPRLLLEWRRQDDLFASVAAHARSRPAWITSHTGTESSPAEYVTPDMFDTLGVVPIAGRPFRTTDAEAGAPLVAAVSERLARRLFGSATAALEQPLDISGERTTIVGVLPASFHFPTFREEIWRPLDPIAWSRVNQDSNVRNVARVRDDRPFDDIARAVAERAPRVLAAAALDRPRPGNDDITLERLASARYDARGTTTFMMLAGAAACLLLIVCANITSLEMASAARRARVFALQAALGAPRATLLRAGLLEGALLIGASALLAAARARGGIAILLANLTTTMQSALVNDIDLDARAILFMAAIAAVAWTLTSLPVARRALGGNLVDLLRDDPRVMPVSARTSLTRRLLMSGQVALTVLLLVGGLLYIRSYIARSGLAKGFDAVGLASIVVSPAPDAPVRGADLDAQLLARLRTFAGVRSVARAGNVPPSSTAGGFGGMTIDGRTDAPVELMLATYAVDEQYFPTMGIPIVQGRVFAGVPTAEAPTEIVVDERFARRFFPNGDALGAIVRLGGVRLFGGGPGHRIVGVASRLRADRTQTDAGEDVFLVYGPLKNWAPLTFIVRLDDERRLPALTGMLRTAAARSIVRVETLEARYGRLNADTRLAASITTGFGVLALVIATAGIYAVMAFLVAGRRREIGVRMALGADARDVRRLIFGSSLRFVLSGAGLGLGGAIVASRGISAQLFGVTPTDPISYGAVTASVVIAALAATWAPARAAARVDPCVTLRAE